MNAAANRQRRSDGGAYWIYGTHAVRAALRNPRRRVKRLLATERNVPALDAPGRAPQPELVTAQRITARLEPGAVHGGVAALVDPLAGGRAELATVLDDPASALLLLLDQVTDPRNVGAILRSASAFGAAAVLAPSRRAPSESGALARAASGALDRVPYLRIGNLAETLAQLDERGWNVVGLDESAGTDIGRAARESDGSRTALVLGAEGAGLRRLTRERCHRLARIPALQGMPSLNVSAAAAVALYAFTRTSPSEPA